MNSRTRGFLVSSAAIVVVGLGVGLLAYYGTGASAGASAGPVELAYVPADSTAVAYADVRGIMNSEFRQRLQQVLPTGEERDKIEAELGINFERDIDALVAGLTTDAQAEPDHGVLLVRGRINAANLEARAREHGAVAQEYRGKRLFLTNDQMAASRPETAQPGFAMLENGLVAVGPVAGLRQAIDAAATRQNITGNADMMRFINQMDPSSHAWIVGKFDAVSHSASLPAEVRDRIPPVQWVAASARMNGGLTGALMAETRDDQSGDQLRDVVRGALAAAQLMTGQDAKLDAMVKSVQVAGVGKNVSVTFSLPVELLDMINGMAAAHRLTGGR